MVDNLLFWDTRIECCKAVPALQAITSLGASTFCACARNWQNHAIVTNNHITSLCKAIGVDHIRLTDASMHVDGQQVYVLTFETKNDSDPNPKIAIITFSKNGENASARQY